MQLTKQVPARRKTITFKWLKRDFMTMSPRFRKIRRKARNKLDACYWCRHKFEDGEMMALGQIVDVGPNKVFCQSCAAEATGEERANG